MLYAMFGDYHGTDLGDLESALSQLNPDVLISLGDFDQVSTIHQWMELKQMYKNQGKRVISVPGNHDHAFFTGNRIDSPTFRRIGKTGVELYKELQEDEVALEYVKSLLSAEDHTVDTYLDMGRFGEKYSTIVVHGALDGDLGSSSAKNNLWNRLLEDEYHLKNFKAMKKKGYKIMIRGHDHQPEYAVSDLNARRVETYPHLHSNTLVNLHDNLLHTITVGPLFLGEFATIDTNYKGKDVPILRFCNLKEFE